MPSVKVTLSPQIIGMRIFPELEVALKEAIFGVVGDMVARENIDIASQYGEQADSIEIVASIDWKRRLLPSRQICERLTTEANVATVTCVAKNLPGTAANIQTRVTAQ